ncbi:MAG: glutathione peroxidase [Saprospiraceae bacterium]|nr:glutathione peroxidase [Saprospiraceae bacterium]
MKNLIPLGLLASILLLASSFINYTPQDTPNIYQFSVNDIAGNAINLSKYEGKVILVVNVASKCSYNKQYADLQKLYDQYSEQGLVVLGFPSNSFNQEPGKEEEIRRFCTQKYAITFPMFSKIAVKGTNIHPLYQFLTSKKENQVIEAPVKWNFQKFLINQKGEVVKSFKPGTQVTDRSFQKVFQEVMGS